MARPLSAPWNEHLADPSLYPERLYGREGAKSMAQRWAAWDRDMAEVRAATLPQPRKKQKGPAQTPRIVGSGRRNITKAKRERIYKRDGYRCVKCGRADRLSIDHIVPLVRGGSKRDSNLQTMCEPCNVAKGD
jgi:hypothetical protein